MIPVAVVIGLLVSWLLLSVKVLNEYERGVIFRIGKLLPQPKGPGLILVAWPIDDHLPDPHRLDEGAARGEQGIAGDSP